MANILQGIKEWMFGIGNEKYKKDPYTSMCANTQAKEAFKVYALQICINKLGNALSMCDFVTYEYDEKKKKVVELKGNLFYQLNIEPNINQSASDFYQKLVRQAVIDPDGALIVQLDNQLVIADSFKVKEFAIKPNIYSDVKIGDLMLERGFNETEVIRIKPNNAKINTIVNSVYDEYGQLISGAIRNYNRGNAKKLWVKLGTMFNQLESKEIINEDGSVTTEADLVLDDLFKNRLKDHFSEKDSATPLEDGIEISETAGDKTGNTNSQTKVTTRDITSLFDDIVNYTADAFGIPRGLLKGDVADIEGMTDNFINFCVRPWARTIEDEYNRKLYKKQQILKGDKLKVKTQRIKSNDPIKVASSLEALYRIGTVNVEYGRWLIDEEPIGEAWAEDYALTKNYQRNKEAGEEVK